MDKTYKSAIDLWLGLLLLAAVLFPMLSGISIAFGLHWLGWHESLGRLVGLIFVGGGLIVIALIFTLALPCRYVLGPESLVIHCGVMTWTIPYREIERIELTYNLWIAPALSVTRVRIVMKGGIQLISPRQREAFLAELQGRLIPASAQNR